MAKSKKTSFKALINRDALTLIDFYATWCGPCKMMIPTLKDLKSELEKDERIIKIDIDRNQALAHKLNIQSVPTLLLYKNGKVLWRQSGAQSLGALRKLFKQHRS